MLRALTRLFPPTRAGKRAPATRRRVATARPQVESLGERVLPATGLGPVTGTSLWPVNQPPIVRPFYFGPSVVGKSVEITEPGELIGHVLFPAVDIGKVTFTQMDVYGDFQGTYESHLGMTPGVPAWLESTYGYSLDIGPIAISGHLSSVYILGLGLQTSISFTGTATGMATESRVYPLIDATHPPQMPGPAQHETEMIADQQTVSFSGTVSQSTSGLALNGTVTQNDTVQWVWDLDNLAPTDPNHQQLVESRLLGVTNVTVTGVIM
jgi:hypothetical protein